MRKSIYILVAVFMAATMVLTSCGPAATTVAPATNVPVSAPPTAVPPTAVPTPATADVAASLPRNETLYFNGQQWGSVVCWNPYSSSCNNAMAIAPRTTPASPCSKPRTCTTCSMASSILCWLMVPGHGTAI